MIISTQQFSGYQDQPVFYHCWSPNSEVKIRAVLQIAHGMAEHSARYARFAEVITAQGFVVYASDHRGHGQTAPSLDEVGYFEEGDFWEKTLCDLHILNRKIREEHPEIPVFLFGHSMGSMLWRNYAALHREPLNGMVLSGTGGDPGALGRIGAIVAGIQTSLRGRKVRSKTMNALAFGSFNSHFKPIRTNFDWLSRDEGEVDKYVADDYCGGVFTTGFFRDLLQGVRIINSSRNYQDTPRELPVYLMAGRRDPVGNMGKGVRQVFESYRRAGLTDVTCKLYEGAHHELLNEINREEVTADLMAWLNGRL